MADPLSSGVEAQIEGMPNSFAEATATAFPATIMPGDLCSKLLSRPFSISLIRSERSGPQAAATYGRLTPVPDRSRPMPVLLGSSRLSRSMGWHADHPFSRRADLDRLQRCRATARISASRPRPSRDLLPQTRSSSRNTPSAGPQWHSRVHHRLRSLP